MSRSRAAPSRGPIPEVGKVLEHRREQRNQLNRGYGDAVPSGSSRVCGAAGVVTDGTVLWADGTSRSYAWSGGNPVGQVDLACPSIRRFRPVLYRRCSAIDPRCAPKGPRETRPIEVGSHEAANVPPGLLSLSLAGTIVA